MSRQPEQSPGPLPPKRGKPASQGRDQLNMDNAPIIEVAAGLDVSKDTLDLAIVPDGLVRVFSNDSAGHAKLMLLLKKVDLIVIEASGGFERVIVAELVAADLPVVLVNPRQVRDFARSSVSRRSTGTAACSEANATRGAVGRACAALSTWLRSWAYGAIPSSNSTTSIC